MSNRLLLVILMIFTAGASAKDPAGKRSDASKPSGVPVATLANVNNISAWYQNNSKHENNPNTGNSGLSYPRGTSYAIYSAGLMFGAYSNDGAMAANQPRVVGNSYNAGFAPGAILGNRTGITEDPEAVDVRIWRIRRDYATADLKMDAAEIGSKALALVTEADVTPIRNQYRKDWQEWPASKGAPFYDANNDGLYTPQFEMVGGIEVPKKYPAADEPGLANADQVVWYVANDIRAGSSPWATKPMGLEQQVTIWGYNNTGVVGNTLFKKFKLIYKGTALTPVNGVLTDAYVAHWSDPDLGDPGDDYVGCDTNLSVGYVYNSSTVDREFQKFKLVPPAVGYDFLQGPAIPSANDTAIIGLKKRPGLRNLPMTSFIYFAAGGVYSDPPFLLTGASQWYSMMMGRPPVPQPPPFPLPIKNPITGDTTKFWLNGDPVTKTGWNDGYWEFPGDRRMLQSSGPFTMAVGDTQEIVVGVVGAIGETYIQSIVEMRESDRYVQAMYNSLFEFVPPTLSVNVTYPNSLATLEVKAAGGPGQFSSIKGVVLGNDLTLFDDGTHNDGTAGDGIFANTIAVARSKNPISLDLTVVTAGNKSFRVEKAADAVTIAGPIELENVTVLFDNINGDKVVNNGEYIHFGVTLKNNTTYTLDNVGVGYFSSVDFNGERPYGTIASGANASISYNSSDAKTYFSFRLPLNYSESNYRVKLIVKDDFGNQWAVPYEFPVVKQAFIADSIATISANVIGNNDGEVGIILYNPAIAGEVYDIWYGGNISTKNWTVVKNQSGPNYAAVNANLSAKKQVPSITTLPNALGSGTFTLNDAKNQVAYSISVSGLTGAIMGARIHRGDPNSVGNLIHPLTVSGNSVSGTWALPESLVTDFIAGNLYVNIITAANPSGEIRGQISDGLVARQLLPAAAFTSQIFSLMENRLSGFSLFVGPALRGTKGVMQTAPSVGNVFSNPNPENTYRILDNGSGALAGTKATESNVEIRFNNEVNWGLTSAGIPSQSYPIKVPFAVYKDTIRVMPIILDQSKDTIWNTTGNSLWNNKPIFDGIYGIVDNRDAANNDISYYTPNNTTFPPTSSAQKGRYINGANHIVKNIYIVNEQANNIPPASGTAIQFRQYVSVKSGDIKSITLRTLGVPIDRISSVAEDFSLSQNYPNPFNPSTRIEFSLPKHSFVILKIYDVIGREVAVIFTGEKEAGRYQLEWNGLNHIGRPVSSGVYFYQITAGSYIQSRKMILLR